MLKTSVKLQFLALRHDWGLLIQTLHIMTSIHNELRDSSLIDLMQGLEIVSTIWGSDRAREYTYVWESGNAEQLLLDYYIF
jgi:hypothetical protein